MAEELHISELRIESKPLKYLEENVRISLDKVKGNNLGGSSNLNNPLPLPEFWKRLGSCVEALSKESNKISVAFCKPPLPAEKEVQALVGGIELVIIGLLSTYSSLTPSCGNTLHKVVQTFVCDVLKAFLDLICDIKNSHKEESLKSVGVVWEYCGALENLPKDPREAVLKEVKACFELINDAVTEAEELCQGCEEEEEGEPIKEDIKILKKQIRSSSLGLAKVAKALITKTAKAISKNGKSDNTTMIIELENVCDTSQQVSPCVDDLICCLYSTPIDEALIKSEGVTLATLLQKLIECCRNSHFCVETDHTWLDFLAGALEHNLQNLNPAQT